MTSIARLKTEFPVLTDRQLAQFEKLLPLYIEWNSRINVISRKDMEQFYVHHVLHSLAIAKFISFAPCTTILDVGTGGGFPGIPLAIFFPECKFTLVDSIGKKIKVVQAVADALQLQNVTALQSRAETLPASYDFIVSRAVTALPEFTTWVWNKINIPGNNAQRNGIIYLKGGDLTDEIAAAVSQLCIAADSVQVEPVGFSDIFFQTKKIVYIPR